MDQLFFIGYATVRLPVFCISFVVIIRRPFLACNVICESQNGVNFVERSLRHCSLGLFCRLVIIFGYLIAPLKLVSLICYRKYKIEK